MKNLYLLIFFSFSFIISAQNEFITTWEVDSNDLSITIPTTGTGYNYAIDFGDGNSLTNVSGDISHNYSTAGIYTITITGDFPRIYFLNNQTDADKILSVEQWGSNPWQSMQSAFAGCSNLQILAVDTPDLSQVTNMDWMFSSATSLNQPINDWDVSQVTSMRGIFYAASNFNQPLASWDVSNVNNMSYMFASANAFNQPLNNWNVSNVTNMEEMFNSNQSFNQLIDNWNVSQVITMKGMFGSSVFNQPIDNWDVSNVTNMNFMFTNGTFNQSLNNWNVSNVTQMDLMFSASLFNQPLDQWDVSNVITMFSIFNLAENFNQDLSNWNFNPAVDFRRIVSSSNLDIDNYDALLAHFVELGYTNKVFRGIGLYYCNEEDRNFLINNLGWDFSTEDSLAENCNLSTENINSYKLTIYPNPTSGIVFINASNNSIIEKIEMVNIHGQRIHLTKPYYQKIDLSGLPSGIYFLKINENVTKKIIKK